MSTSKLRLQYLFHRYYHKTATEQERDELFALISEGKHEPDLQVLIEQTWDDLHIEQKIFNEQQKHQMLLHILTATPVNQPKKGFIKWIGFAAIAAMLTVVAVAVWTNTRLKPDKHLAIHKKQQAPLNDALPGSNKAILKLADGNTITLDDATVGTVATEGKTLIKKTADGKIIYNTAALTSSADTSPVLNTISTPKGGQYQVALPDGTHVWLNSASSLTFPTRFTGHTRQVSITGEAYFEVAKIPDMPFKVKAPRAEIQVLGTHFNVMAYDDEQVMKTTLLEGSVNIHSGGFSAKLVPGQQAQINSDGKNKVLNNVDVDDELAWKNGLFQFRDAKIDAILRQASRWYNVNVVYKGRVPNQEFNGRISKNVKASELLNMLKYAGVNVEIEGNNIVVN